MSGHTRQRGTKKDPSYRLHKQSGQAIVTLPNGFGGRKDVLLGGYDSAESWTEYYRVLAEWKVNGRRLPVDKPEAAYLTVNELILAYLRYAEGYYIKEGKPTSEQDTIRQAVRPLKQLYGRTPAKDFGPLALKAVREAMVRHPIARKVQARDPETGKVLHDPKTGAPILVEKVYANGLARRYINKQVGRIKRLFAWAVEQELLPVTVHQALLRVGGIKKGKSQAREKPKIGPVPEVWVNAVLPLVPPTVRTMIEVQQLCGGRPQDIVGVRALDLDMSGPVWEYRPRRYKTEHRNEDDNPDKERIVFLGPRAQALLKPYLTLSLADYLFSPRRSEEQRNADRRDRRKVPLWPSHAKRRDRGTGRRRTPPRDHYDVASYRRAIRRACLKAGIPVWFPLQLRHSRGTEIRKHYGLEASQAVLGHSELGVTQVYAEVDRETARRVMGEIG